MASEKWFDGVTPEWINSLRNSMKMLEHSIVEATHRGIEGDRQLPDWLDGMREETEQMKAYILDMRERHGYKVKLYEEGYEDGETDSPI